MKQAPDSLWDERLRALEQTMVSADLLPFVYPFPAGTGPQNLVCRAAYHPDDREITAFIYRDGKEFAKFSADICPGDSGLNMMFFRQKDNTGPPFSYEFMRRVVFWAWQTGLSHLLPGIMAGEKPHDFFGGIGFQFLKEKAVLEHTADPSATAQLVALYGLSARGLSRQKSFRVVAILNRTETLQPLLEKLQLPGIPEPVTPPGSRRRFSIAAATKALK